MEIILIETRQIIIIEENLKNIEKEQTAFKTFLEDFIVKSTTLFFSTTATAAT